MVYRVLEQLCREWGVPPYISTIDFTKAFDSIKTFCTVDVAEVLWSQTCVRETAAEALQPPGGNRS